MQCGRSPFVNSFITPDIYEKNKLNKSYDILRPFKNFLNIKKLYYALLIRKVPKWSRVIIVIPPKFWGQQRGQLPGTPGDAKPQTSKTLDNVSIRFLAGACAGATACSLTYPSLGIYGGSMGMMKISWYDMAIFDTYTVTVHVTVYVIYIYYIFTIYDICLCIFSKFLGQKQLTSDSSMKAKGYQMC